MDRFALRLFIESARQALRHLSSASGMHSPSPADVDEGVGVRDDWNLNDDEECKEDAAKDRQTRKRADSFGERSGRENVRVRGMVVVGWLLGMMLGVMLGRRRLLGRMLRFVRFHFDALMVMRLWMRLWMMVLMVWMWDR